MAPTPADLVREFAARSRSAAAPVQPPPNRYHDDEPKVTIDPALFLLGASTSLAAQHLTPANSLASQAAESGRPRSARRPAAVRSPSPAPVASTSAAPAQARHAPMPVYPMLALPTPFNFPPPPPPQPAPEALSTSWVPSPLVESPIPPLWLSAYGAFAFGAPLFPAAGAAAPPSLAMTMAPPTPMPSTRRTPKSSSRQPRVTPGPFAVPMAPAASMAPSAPAPPAPTLPPPPMPTLPSPTPLPPPQHEMEEAAADALMPTIQPNSAGKFACPVPGCGSEVGSDDALKRHLIARRVPCPQRCGQTISRGNLRSDAMDRHLNRSCRNTAKEIRDQNRALAKQRKAERDEQKAAAPPGTVGESSRARKRRRFAPDS